LTWEGFLPAGEIALEITREARGNKPEIHRIMVRPNMVNEVTIRLGQ
jgi:hypothetical protein